MEKGTEKQTVHLSFITTNYYVNVIATIHRTDCREIVFIQ